MVSDRDIQDWVQEQFKNQGWTDSELKRARRHAWGVKWGTIGGFLCIFIITAPIGLPLFCFGLYRAVRYWDPGADYREAKDELQQEHERRNENGEALWEDVDEEWWEERLPSLKS